MPSDLSSYLATNYLVADSKPSASKKRKRKQAEAGLIIADDDEPGWNRPGGNGDDEDGAEGTATVAGTSAEFRRAKKSAWKAVGAPATAARGLSMGGGAKLSNQDGGDDDTAAADAILASAAAETAAAGADDDGGPVMIDEDDDGVGAAPESSRMMSDGTYAGLQTAAKVSAQLERRRRQERAEFDKMRKDAQEAETVYRDATGRRVDVSFKRAEARRAAQEAADKEERARLALRGEVQVEEARRRREELDDARVMAVARHADDEDMNRELKDKVRWGDTMAEFVGKSGGGGGSAAKSSGSGGGAAAGGRAAKGRPLYQGAAPPNRYGIRPGYRWDGVDRSNGFEAERFKAINRRERNKGLEYSWQMDE